MPIPVRLLALSALLAFSCAPKHDGKGGVDSPIANVTDVYFGDSFPKPLYVTGLSDGTPNVRATRRRRGSCGRTARSSAART